MSLRILCVHGVNTDENGTWFAEWQKTIRAAANHTIDGSDNFNFHELRYNPRFESIPFSAKIAAEATKRLWNSYWAHQRTLGRGADKGLGSLVNSTIGMVAKWTALADLRQQLRADLKQRIQEVDPHIICAHSLGSLIAYDLLAQESELAKGRLLLTLGSQIGHPGVRDSYGSYLKPIDTLKHWYHLFNAEDDVMTCELDFPAANFTQLDTFFDEWGPLDHSAECYLSHPATVANVWAGITTQQTRALDAANPTKLNTKKGAKTGTKSPAVTSNWYKTPTIQQRNKRQRRALLIGINDYPQAENKLNGCINDVFLMSALLQERGYDADEIRIVLDDRATTKGVNERLKWLLRDVREGDERVLFYSGHGAQITAYDAAGEPDHKDETLVTYDFDWTTNYGITDDVLAKYYADLPYKAKFTIILDCCNSGGMARAGGVTVRGMNPPDDIRHRSIYWDSDKQMWFSRTKRTLIDRMDKPSAREIQRFLGKNGDTQKIGRAVGIWGTNPKQFKANKQRLNHQGPYTPVILAACKEDQFAYEYTHGVTAYGAMTYMLAQQLREEADKPLEAVVRQCNRVLKNKLRFEQDAQLFRYPEHAQTHFPRKPKNK
jgi:metacaspase-1